MTVRRSINRILLRLLRLRKRAIESLVALFGSLRSADQFFMITSAILIGILGAMGAIGFRYLIKLSHRSFFQTWEYSLEIVHAMPWYWRLALPVLGGLLVGPIVQFVAREVRGSGIPEVMESVATRGGAIRPRVILAKTVAAAITIGSGGSAGREGPIVQIGSAIGSAYGQLLSISARRLRTFVACGAAAGIAATFNAPIAGALFAVEVIIGDFAVSQFSAIVISSVVATVISRHYIGDFPAFRVPGYELVSSYEFIPYTILGILAGLVAVAFILVIYRAHDLFEKLPIPFFTKPALGGLAVGLIAVVFPEVFGVGYETINEALWGRGVTWLFAILIVAKMLATAATLGSSGSGGVFAPCLFIGALLGALVGGEANALYPELMGTPGAYALVGMGAVVAGATHAPISAILIIFELTNDYRIIPPLMVACIISVVLTTYIKRESIYTEKLVRRGINIFEGRDINVLKRLKVDQVLNRDVERIHSREPFREIVRRFLQSHHEEFFVVDDTDQLVGRISLQDVKQLLQEEDYLEGLVIAADLTNPPISTLYLDDNLDLVMHTFGRHNVDELPVLENRGTRRLVGSLRRRDIIDAYNREIFKWELAGGMHSVVTAVSKDRSVELAEGYRLMEIEPPDGFVGRSIRQLNIRARYGVEVLLIRTAVQTSDGLLNRPGVIPRPDYVIQGGDRLLVMGGIKELNTLSGMRHHGPSTPHRPEGGSPEA